MNTLKSLWLLFSIISICSADTCTKLCVFDNVTCITNGGIKVYKNAVNGVRGLLKPLDPLYIREIYGVMETVKFKLTNITMIGLKQCSVTEVQLNATVNIYKQYLYCPKLVSHFHFEAEENTNIPVLRGKGIATVVAYNYYILNYGEYAVFVNNDHRPHFFVKTHNSRIHLKGTLEFAITKAYIADISRVQETERHMNENCGITENFLLTPIIISGMKILFFNIDIFLRNCTMGEIIPENYK